MNDHSRYELIKMYTHIRAECKSRPNFNLSFMKNHTETKYLMKILDKRINFDKK